MARILLADDDPLLRETLRLALSNAGHEVELAVNGAEAMSLALNGTFEAIVIDVIMPEMTGLESIAAIKAKKPNTKIVAMSGGGRIRNLDVLDIAQRVGASLTLSKPFSMKDFTDALNRVLAEPDD